MLGAVHTALAVDILLAHRKYKMTREQLLQLHKDTCDMGRDIMAAKNADYTGGSEDIFANFTASEILDVPAEIGILMRVMDKLQRIKSFVHNGTLQVKSESVDDAILDVINYMILIKGVIKNKQLSYDPYGYLKPVGECKDRVIVNMPKHCDNCLHEEMQFGAVVCGDCNPVAEYRNWEPVYQEGPS